MTSLAIMKLSLFLGFLPVFVSGPHQSRERTEPVGIDGFENSFRCSNHVIRFDISKCGEILAAPAAADGRGAHRLSIDLQHSQVVG